MITPLFAPGVDNFARSRPSLVLPCFVDSSPCSARFNSLFDRLGNSRFDNQNINGLRGQILSANRLEIDFSQYFPVLQRTTAAGRDATRCGFPSHNLDPDQTAD
jgi:hypothetical protein